MEKFQLIEMYKNYLYFTGYVPDKNKIYYIVWVEKFLMELENSTDVDCISMREVRKYISGLEREPKYEEWQILQAADAIALLISMLGELDRYL